MNEKPDVDVSIGKLFDDRSALCVVVGQIYLICKAINPHDVWTSILCAFICFEIIMLAKFVFDPRSPGGGSTSFNFYYLVSTNLLVIE